MCVAWWSALRAFHPTAALVHANMIGKAGFTAN